MTKRTTIYLLVVILVIAVFGITFFLVDFNLSVRGNVPRLSVKTSEYNDGNTVMYTGLGYKIVKYNIGSSEEKVKCGTWLLMHDPNLDIEQNNQNENSNESLKNYMIGEITKIYDENGNEGFKILVKSNTELSAYNETLVNISSNTIITKEKNIIYKKDLKIGDKVEIKFSGIATKSIPPQITALKIDIKN